MRERAYESGVVVETIGLNSENLLIMEVWAASPASGTFACIARVRHG